MIASKKQYFIAIVPPPPIFDQALELKQYFSDHYQSKASLNSPPHMTLHMPFEWKPEKEKELTNALQKSFSTLNPVGVELNGFDCFAPRVIFINAIKTRELAALQNQVRQFCRKELGLFNADYKDLPFHPHLTLAFRDLKKPAFVKAWEEFKDKEFKGEFLAEKVSLLRHEDRKWNVINEVPLEGISRLQ